MKYFLSFIASVLLSVSANAQITITAADMPVHGDLLSYSNAPITAGNINPGDSGANMTWNYTLSSTSMGVDEYKLALEVNPSFAASISLSAVGYKVADSIPFLSTIGGAVIMSPIPITVTNIYTYFQEITTPRSAYMASANSYTVAGIFPTAANYTNPDVWYFFPLAYGGPTDSIDYALHMSLMSAATIRESGNRKTRVDGWGTITTPYFTTPVNCIRVRSVIHEIDSIAISGMSFGIPRNSVEYKWLVNGEHYPALWVTNTLTNNDSTETTTTVRYRDALVPSKVVSGTPAIYTNIKTYPNPATDGMVTIDLPADWKTFQVEVFDINGKQVVTTHNDRHVNLRSFASGQYIIRITSGVKVGYTTVTK